MIVFNIPGLLMLAAGFGVAFGAGSVLRMTGEGPLIIVAAPPGSGHVAAVTCSSFPSGYSACCGPGSGGAYTLLGH